MAKSAGVGHKSIPGIVVWSFICVIRQLPPNFETTRINSFPSKTYIPPSRTPPAEQLRILRNTSVGYPEAGQLLALLTEKKNIKTKYKI